MRDVILARKRPRQLFVQGHTVVENGENVFAVGTAIYKNEICMNHTKVKWLGNHGPVMINFVWKLSDFPPCIFGGTMYRTA